jgi:hypothetical protein
VGAVASAAGHRPEPVMPTGLSRADQELWKGCKDLHDVYKTVTQASAAALSTQLQPLALALHGNRATPQQRIDFCRLLDERIELSKQLHRERNTYIKMDCDRFDWFNQGRTAAERRADHIAERDHVSREITNLYELRTRFCP